MVKPTDSRAENLGYARLDAAFRAGDFAALSRELGDRSDFPNIVAHEAIGSCLTYAIYHSPLPLVRTLLDEGADPNWPTNGGFPPMIAALTCAQPAPGTTVREDVPELVELLLASGANVDQRGINDYTPLHLAAAQGSASLIDILLSHGADPDAITRIDDYETALEVARSAGHRKVVQRLKPVTTRPSWERAARVGDLDELKRLHSRGYDLDSTDGFGMTALMCAAHGGHGDTVEWLVEQGADLNRSAKHHLTAVMLAVVTGHPRIARRLVAAGADTSARGTGAPGFQGKTAAELADERGERRLAGFLRSREEASGG